MVVDGVEFQVPVGHFNFPLSVQPLSQGVHCLTNWYQDWGPPAWRHAAHVHKAQLRQKRPANLPPLPAPVQYTREWAQKRIETALAQVKKGLVVVAFPSFSPYNKNASLLREMGFKLLGGRCYPNANYPAATTSTLTKGNINSPDGYPHWIHIWVRDLGGRETCGPMTYGQVTTPDGIVQPPDGGVGYFPMCCGLRLRWTPNELKPSAYAPTINPNAYWALCQLPADQKFPKGWKRFARYKDFKWGLNLEHPSVKGVQKCPHEFDLGRIEEWEMAQPLPVLT